MQAYPCDSLSSPRIPARWSLDVSLATVSYPFQRSCAFAVSGTGSRYVTLSTCSQLPERGKDMTLAAGKAGSAECQRVSVSNATTNALVMHAILLAQYMRFSAFMEAASSSGDVCRHGRSPTRSCTAVCALVCVILIPFWRTKCVCAPGRHVNHEAWIYCRKMSPTSGAAH